MMLTITMHLNRQTLCSSIAKSRVDDFQVYPNAIHFNPLQFCPFVSLLSFLVFCLSSSIVFSRYCDILVNSMTKLISAEIA